MQGRAWFHSFTTIEPHVNGRNPSRAPPHPASALRENGDECRKAARWISGDAAHKERIKKKGGDRLVPLGTALQYRISYGKKVRRRFFPSSILYAARIHELLSAARWPSPRWQDFEARDDGARRVYCKDSPSNFFMLLEPKAPWADPRHLCGAADRGRHRGRRRPALLFMPAWCHDCAAVATNQASRARMNGWSSPAWNRFRQHKAEAQGGNRV